MKCDKCHKKATVHLTEIIDGKSREMHLCEECAQEQSMEMEQQFGLSDLLAGLTDLGKQIPEMQKKKIVCVSCGLTYDDFRKSGRFGCADCYTAFKVQLEQLLKKIHGANVHFGKRPLGDFEQKILQTTQQDTVLPEQRNSVDEKTLKIEGLRQSLKTAIHREDFETAARLRDEIRAIEEGK